MYHVAWQALSKQECYIISDFMSYDEDAKLLFKYLMMIGPTIILKCFFVGSTCLKGVGRCGLANPILSRIFGFF